MKYINRFFKGAKKAYLTPTLPPYIINIQKNPLVRIFRVIGGISILLILTNKLNYIFSGIYYIISLYIFTFFAIIFGFYLIILSYLRIIYMIKVLKSDDLDIKNSPLDRFASIAARIIWCSKGFCETAAPIGVAFGGMAGIDELRKAKGLEPIFLPKLADWIIPPTDTEKEVKIMRYNEAALERNFKEGNIYKEEQKIVDVFEKNGIIGNEEASAWRNKLSRNQTMCELENKNITSKILESLDKLNRNKK